MNDQKGNFLYPGFPGIGAPPPDYKEERENPIDENSLRQMDREEINKMMGNWMTVIGRAANESIPENKKIYYAHPIESDYIKLLEQTYNNFFFFCIKTHISDRKLYFLKFHFFYLLCTP